ncbi:Uma2 family endonuclease [Vacuolonema iberomarrocanum]|uniref:Uma2 family endonuclease n=1 Tax=Vacuolonema iberomarrocanum TaxID=3454632 RepID=UPI0019EFBEC8|nr:Uma2 family endonuclease [filamentous cyanobacterium LEGE 07170]
MVSPPAIPPIVAQPIAKPIGERRVVFRSLDWQRYQIIRQALGESRIMRFTYDQGILEVTMPLEDHEFAVRLIERFILILVVELGMKLKTMGSTTLDREVLDRSAEPDNAYYIQNQALVAGRNVNLAQDPPPDLVVEVDITHTDIDKLRFYASMGVPEFWRYNGETWRIYQLQGDRYTETDTSPTFPKVPKVKLYEFLAEARQDEVAAEVAVRKWVRSELV